MRTFGAILVAETDHAVADTITDILRDEGYTASVVHDRAGKLASIVKQRPALVLLDDHVAAWTQPACTRTSSSTINVSIPIVTTTT